MSTGKSTPMKPASPARKNAKWVEREHEIFVTACEMVIAEGHHRGKCFSKHDWDRLEKAEYAKFRNRDVHKIYHRYPILFGQAFDSDKYSMTPTKLSQRRFDRVINSGGDSPHDTLSIFAETRDSSDEGPVELGSSSRMDIYGCQSGEKQKGSPRRSKGKAKKVGSVDLSYSVEHLASVSEALADSQQNCQEKVPTCHYRTRGNGKSAEG
ncbi:Uncharacterized protein Adt_06608 [Abeliophyllum distichum]|uniref:Myb-like domain-containing protein n=1 Tax=Abeliophyllum distichum TaxID=126358 RepID=A0ABD1V7N3_9LAMI